jgi:uncharacterized protein (TIGR02271 family)
MALHKIKDFYPDYREQFGDQDILSYGLYTGVNQEKVGSVDDLLVDDEGRFRYLVINTGAWIFGKKVLMPIGQTRIDYADKRVYADGLSREQVENLPEYDPNAVLDYDYEERVRGVYRPTATNTTGVDATMGGVGLGTASLGGAALDPTPGTYERNVADRDLTNREPVADAYRSDLSPGMDTGMNTGTYDRDSYRYDRDPGLFNLDRPDHQTLKLYEERLVAGKIRQKTGEVSVGKHVETETQHVSVPVERERVVIERVNPTDPSVTVDSTADAFREGEVARVEVYEETPDIRKEAFVREEVRVRKEVDRDTVEADETIRKERLDVDQQGNPIVRE